MSAVTDSENKIYYDKENKPGISNLIVIYATLSNLSIEDVENKFKNNNYGEFKKSVADLVVETLMTIQEKYYKILNSDIINKILDEGKYKTEKIARKKYNEVLKCVGLGRN